MWSFLWLEPIENHILLMFFRQGCWGISFIFILVAGFFLSILSTRSFADSETLSQQGCSNMRSILRMLNLTYSTDSQMNGRVFVSNRCRTTPRLQTSHAELWGCLPTTSGDEYARVPMNWELYSPGKRIVEHPKSANFGVIKLVLGLYWTRMLSDLMSRCTIPKQCRLLIDWTNCYSTIKASYSLKAPVMCFSETHLVRVPPSMYSITIETD